jgi:hypothetical protein
MDCLYRFDSAIKLQDTLYVIMSLLEDFVDQKLEAENNLRYQWAHIRSVDL